MHHTNLLNIFISSIDLCCTAVIFAGNCMSTIIHFFKPTLSFSNLAMLVIITKKAQFQIIFNTDIKGWKKSEKQEAPCQEILRLAGNPA